MVIKSNLNKNYILKNKQIKNKSHDSVLPS